MLKNKLQKKFGGEELFEEARKLCESEGREGWKLAQETMLKERASNPQLQEAIEYVMLKYQPDYLRPALLSFCCKAVGGKPEPTIPTGAALTLLAWAIGIHDDIIDQSKTKNRRPTVLGKFGKDIALILSDVLLFKGFTLLRRTLEAEISVEAFVEILETIEKTWFEQSVGETVEIKSRGVLNITPEECLEKIRMRAAEMEACTRIGGILGDGSKRQIENLGAYGRLIGMMNILRNELVDVLELDVLKRRIRKESLPLPLVYSLQNPRIKSQLTLLIESKLTNKDLRNISRIADHSEGSEKVMTLIEGFAKKALMHSEISKIKELDILAASLPITPRESK